MNENRSDIEDNPSNMPTQKERFLNDTESWLNNNIRKVETDLKESIQKVEKNYKEAIKEVKDDHKEAIKEVKDDHNRLIKYLLGGIGLIFTAAVAIIVALINRGN